MNPRRSRGERPDARGYRITARDREVVLAVGRMAQATTDQLRRLFFGDPSTASRRLSKLVALRLLDVHVVHQDEPNLYTLGSGGLSFLGESGVAQAAVHRSRVGRHGDLHLQRLNDVRVELVLAARGRADVQLEAFHADLDLRRAAGSSPPAYIPDAIAELKTPAGRLALIVEIDLGSEGRSVFASKVEATVGLWRTGAKCWGAAPGAWRPALFVPAPMRARALARTIAEGGGGALWLVTEFERLRAVGALGPVFATADEVAAAPRGVPIPYRGALAPALAELREEVRR